MRLLSRYVSIVALVCVPFGVAVAGPTSACRPKALQQLRADSPDGFAIYKQMTNSDFFDSWIDCHDAQYDLSTAVHESTHFIAAETDAFPLVGGGTIRRPHEVSDFFPPARIADRFPHDDFAMIYLRGGKASSSNDFLYLLDELNAYSHDLATAVDLKGLTAPDEAVDHRDGLAALMAFVAVYAERARASEPETWSGLRQPAAAQTISALWGRAERVMASSCGIPNFGSKDKVYIQQSCSADARSALAPILGRAPVCPLACLTPDVDQASDEVEIGSTAARVDEKPVDDEPILDRPHHPFNIKIGPARHKLRNNEG